MEAPKGDERAAEQAATLFAPPEVESQRINTEGGNKRKKRKIVIGVSFSFFFPPILSKKETPPMSFYLRTYCLYFLHMILGLLNASPHRNSDKHKCLSPSKLMANQVPITSIPPPKNNNDNKKLLEFYVIFLYLGYNYIYSVLRRSVLSREKLVGKKTKGLWCEAEAVSECVACQSSTSDQCL